MSGVGRWMRASAECLKSNKLCVQASSQMDTQQRTATKRDWNAIMPSFAVFPSLVLGFFVHSSFLRWGIFTRNVQNPWKLAKTFFSVCHVTKSYFHTATDDACLAFLIVLVYMIAGDQMFPCISRECRGGSCSKSFSKKLSRLDSRAFTSCLVLTPTLHWTERNIKTSQFAVPLFLLLNLVRLSVWFV